MSLENPTTWEKVIAFLKQKPVYIIIGLFALVVFTWWALHALNVHEQNKKIEQSRANVNAALQNVANAQATVNKDAANEAAAIQHLQDATNEHLNDVNATEQQRVVTNQAIANVQKAVNANVPVGSTAEDVHRLLDDIDNQQ